MLFLLALPLLWFLGVQMGYPVSYTHLDVYKRQLPVPIQLVPLPYDNLDVLFGAGRFLQPPHSFRSNLPFQPLFADRRCV